MVLVYIRGINPDRPAMVLKSDSFFGCFAPHSTAQFMLVAFMVFEYEKRFTKWVYMTIQSPESTADAKQTHKKLYKEAS